MTVPAGRSTWRRLRQAFRWCRVGLLFMLLALLAAFLYFQQAGLPDVLKAPLLAELQRRGVNLEFQRLSWRWYQGFVAEEAHLRAGADGQGPQLRFAEVALNLDWDRLLRARQVEIESLRIRGGRVTLPLHEPGATPEHCSFDDISAAVRFLPGNEWELDELRASFLGATFQASGIVTNALVWTTRASRVAATNLTTQAKPWRDRLRDVVTLCNRMQFSEPPSLRLRFQGDARNTQSFVCELRCQAAGAKTPWIELENLRLAAEMNRPPPTNGGFHVTVSLQVDDARTPWGDFREAELHARTTRLGTNPVPSAVDWELTAREVKTLKAGFRSAQFNGHSVRLSENAHRWQTDLRIVADGLTTEWGHALTNRLSTTFEHSLTNVTLTAAEVQVDLESLETRWGQTAHLAGAIRMAPATNAPDAAPPRSWWSRFAPYSASWHFAATAARSPQLTLDELSLAGSWAAPSLALSNLHARLYGGALDITNLHANLATRAARAELSSDFDAHAVAPLLGQGVARWLDQFRWAKPPRVAASIRGVLPDLDRPEPGWARQAVPDLVLEARVRGEQAAYRDVPIDQAELAVSFSNLVLRLRDFHVVRPEGEADLAYDLHTATQEFRWQVNANLDPKRVGPAIDRDAPRLLSLFEFGGPARVAGEVWGRWGTNRELNLALGGVITNFTFRGEAIDELRAGIRLTNDFLTATNVSLRTGSQWAQASAVGVDLRQPWVYLTNVDAEIDPMLMARAIGSNVVRVLSPYRFDQPPRVHAEGHVPAQGSVSEANMRFSVAGGPFHFWRFNVTNLETQVLWEGDRVVITNAACGFYEGTLKGHLRADIQPDGTANLAFRTTVTNVNLKPLVADTIPTTNRIEGTLQGTLDVAFANSADWKSWDGSGRLVMRDGLLWDLPVFSVLSPMLNAAVPGLGNNRARAATGSFTITNSVMHTDNLDVVANPARLSYWGTLDFDWNLRARVEAEILPGTPLIGPILNILFAPVTKALVFKITGTLGEPKIEPVYIPKFLMPVFRPFQTLKSVFPGKSTPAAPPTPTPPTPPPP